MGVSAAFFTVSYLNLSSNWLSDNAFTYVTGWLDTGASLGGMMGQTP